jgi:hypothetical protein
MVKRSRTKSRGFKKDWGSFENTSADRSDVPDSQGFQAFSRGKSQTFSRSPQGPVNHVSQGLVNHAGESWAGDGGLTSLFKPIRNALGYGLAYRPGI